MADINYEIVVSPEVVVETTVIDKDVEVTVDDANSQAVTVTDPDVISENAEAEEILTVVINTGEKGDKGDIGPEGPEGPGLQIDASGNTAGRSAYDSEAEGFVYLDTEAGLLYRRETATPGVWSTGVDFGGADGVDGNTILSGTSDPTTEGVDGDFYINTSTQFIFGPKAGTWPAGVDLNGAPGIDGRTILSGASDPTTEGEDGDFYINTSSNYIFGPKSGTWPAGISLVGPQGDPGADGNTILYGIVNPTTEGNDGDFYINTSTDYIFGPKSGTWPGGVSLVGPQGDPGNDGNTILYGTSNPTTQGVDGDFYINTTTDYIFGPKSGTWPTGTSLVGPQGDPGTNGTNFQPDATGDTAGRSAYDSEAIGFSYLDTSTDTIYFRETSTPGVWSAGVAFGTPGPEGPAGTPGPPGEDYAGPMIYTTAILPGTAIDGDIWIDTSP